MKKYFIREVGFMYDDEGNSKVEGFGGVKNSFDNSDEAIKELKRLTLEKWKGTSPLSYSGFFAEQTEGLDKFVQENFGDQLLYDPDENGLRDVNFDFKFPKDITEDQAWKIREISQIHHFELIEQQNDEPVFWGFRLGTGMKQPNTWTTREAFKVDANNNLTEHGKVPIFFTTRDEAFEHLRWMPILHYFSPIGIIGSFEELSDTPKILKSIIEQDERIEYYENANRLILSRLWDGEKLLTINSLLKEKFIEVAPIPIKELQRLGSGWIPSQ